MVITRRDWRINGDLLEWIATTFPGLSNAQFEAGYALLADADDTDKAVGLVDVLLAGCVGANGGEEVDG